MSDPAVEAAYRAARARKYFLPSDDVMLFAAEAAREALRPIRELHKPVDDYGDGVDSCMTCECKWPCETADLIYTAEELA